MTICGREKNKESSGIEVFCAVLLRVNHKNKQTNKNQYLLLYQSGLIIPLKKNSEKATWLAWLDKPVFVFNKVGKAYFIYVLSLKKPSAL